MVKQILAVLLGLSLLGGTASAVADEYEKRLEKARKELDEAAARLAEAYSAAYESGSHKHDRAMLGVLLDDCCVRDGVALSGVTPGGGADQAGLEAGDILIEVGGTQLTGEGNAPLRKLTRFMRDVKAGDAVATTFLRGGEKTEVTVTTQAHGQQMMHMLREKVTRIGEDLGSVHSRVYAPEPPIPPRELLTFMDVEGDLASYFGVREGILVLRGPDGDSAMKAGDIILSIDGDTPKDASAAYAQLAGIEDDTNVTVMRQGKRRAVTVAAGEITSGEDVRIIRIEVKRD